MVQIHSEKRMAWVYPYLKIPEPPDFMLHEVLHCALRELERMDRRKPKDIRAAEEQLVRDICVCVRKGL